MPFFCFLKFLLSQFEIRDCLLLRFLNLVVWNNLLRFFLELIRFFRRIDLMLRLLLVMLLLNLRLISLLFRYNHLFFLLLVRLLLLLLSLSLSIELRLFNSKFHLFFICQSQFLFFLFYCHRHRQSMFQLCFFSFQLKFFQSFVISRSLLFLSS